MYCPALHILFHQTLLLALIVTMEPINEFCQSTLEEDFLWGGPGFIFRRSLKDVLSTLSDGLFTPYRIQKERRPDLGYQVYCRQK